MSGRIDFFCDAAEEVALVEHILSDDVVGLEPVLQDPNAPMTIDVRSAPVWPEAFRRYLWLKSGGNLQWHTSMPRVEGATHGELVANLFAAEAWEKLNPREGIGFLNVDRSPILVYERPGASRGPLLPSALVCPPSSPEQVSPEYARWVRRLWSWIRRRATRIHDWREQHPRLRNDSSFLNSVYAFPRALAALNEEPAAYAISVRLMSD